MKKTFLLTLIASIICSIAQAKKKEFDEIMPEEAAYSITQVSTQKIQYLLIIEKWVKKTPLSQSDLAGNACCNAGILWGGGRYFNLSADGTKKLSNSSQTIIFEDVENGKGVIKKLDVCVGPATEYISTPYQTKSGRLIFCTNNGMYYTTESKPEKIHKVSDNSGTIIGEHNGYIYYTRSKTLWKCNLKSYESESVMSGYYACSMKYPYVYCSKGCKEGHGEITRYNIESKKFEKLLSNSQQGYYGPMVSPDGQWLLMTGNALSPLSKKQNVDILLYNLKTKKLYQLTTHPGHDWHPTWGKDSKTLYFLSSRYKGNSNDYQKSVLYKMDISPITGK